MIDEPDEEWTGPEILNIKDLSDKPPPIMTQVLIPANRIPRSGKDWLALETPLVVAGGEDFYDGWESGPFPGGWMQMSKEERQTEMAKGHIFRTILFYYPNIETKERYLEQLRNAVPWFVKLVP